MTWPRTPYPATAGYIALAAIATELCVSANLLTVLGLPYVSDGGALPLKIHPATYALALAALLRLFLEPRPDRFAWRFAMLQTPVAAYLAGLVLCLCYAAVTTGGGALIVLIDTFLPAGLLALALSGAPAPLGVWLRQVLLIAIALNAAMAAGETVLHAHLVPLYLNGKPFHESGAEFRPTGLSDHPLTGASFAMIGVFLVLDEGWPMPRRAAACAALLVALLMFGGRTALALTALILVAALGGFVGRRALRRRLCLVTAVWSVVAVPLAGALMLALALTTDFADRIATHLYWDDSANVRLQQWHVLDALSPAQLLFGTPRADLLSDVHQLSLQYPVGVIENCWLLLLAALGVLGLIPFLLALGAFLVGLWRQASGWRRVMLIAVLLVASTNNSLGRKSTLLTVLTAAAISVRGDATARRRMVAPRFPLTAIPS